jgi:protein-S-isoprenylcysteine O-methyltransferase Ste14
MTWLIARALPQLAGELPFATPLAASIAVAGVALCVLGVLPFRRAGTTLDPTRPERASRLVTNGIFAATRNPMYLGVLLLLVAWGVYLSNALGLLLAPLSFFIFMNRVQIVREERALQAAFGDEYASYKRRVRRWI